MQWSEVVNNPLFENLPFKIELDKFGKILMSPASNQHGRLQIQIGAKLSNQLPNGEVIAECSIQTAEGVKVADVAWASNEFIEIFGYQTPYPKAPEICVEIISPSNHTKEMEEKIGLYLAKGAQEVWLVNEKGEITPYSHTGEIEKSRLAPEIH